MNKTYANKSMMGKMSDEDDSVSETCCDEMLGISQIKIEKV